ncbi:type I-E CRISPR-associated protein Cse2/CasB [Erwinia sp. HR93]|uniref:type I-E CRISPR-associated protein Cse2/CasB n=1 Tax=Erwinia sp. HR93 TaxID=3094840 RepID=UPI002ADEAD4C|nr:type I-E CRISPR-associated protein Cse2/CasB [Erwinia sp. HR93]MEA1064179.1 type I-E CRISPR-associated protein Cse2/CasB [Erwinia sp. HR93]
MFKEFVTAVPMQIKNKDAQQVLLQWFDDLSERGVYGKEENNKPPKRLNGRAWRAELKRVDPPWGAMMCEGFVILRQRLSEHMTLTPVQLMALALFASVAAHVKKYSSTAKNSEETEQEEKTEEKEQKVISFAAQLGQKLKGDRPCVSKIRFERILKANDPAVLCNLLIRAVKIRGNAGVNLVSLADGIFMWVEEWHRRVEHQPETGSPYERIHIRWANEYLSTLLIK